MAKQLYDYWFVQFDFPDENGKPYKSSGGKMVWNDKLKREIPEGWNYSLLSEYLCVYSEKISTKDVSKDDNYAPIEVLPRRKMSFSECAPIENALSGLCRFKHKHILLSNRRVYFHKICIAPFDGLTRDTVIILYPTKTNLLGYSYQLVNDDVFIEYATKHSYGSEQPVLSWEEAKQYKVVKPPQLLECAYSRLIEPIIDQVIRNELEISAMVKQRDELLPLLITGQVSVTQLNNDLASHILLPYMFFTHKRLYLYGLNITHMKEPGYVYILTNPSFKEDWVKIGKSSRPVNVRSKELDNTAVPLPFEIFATIRTVKFNEVEKLIHKTIDRLTDLRIRQNREFFNIQPQIALDILRDISTTIDDAFIELYHNNQPIKEAAEVQDEEPHKRRAPFRFSMVNIQIGETVVFTPKNIKVKVASDNQVEYEGRIYKLSPFTAAFLPDEMRRG